ncbi:MAG: phosphonate metabolism transcriptional regulator PhnF [Hyphomicrobiaceae bacterium]
MNESTRKRGRDAGAEIVGAEIAGAASVGPRWQQIANALAASIERGAYTDGSILPSAASIAERYGVHRHTARQAFRHLEELGLVSVTRGRGTTVTGQRIPYRIGRRVSFRANFGAAGVKAAGTVLDCRLAEAAGETAVLLGVATGDPVWEIRMTSRAAGAAVSTSVHTLSEARFPAFDAQIIKAKASTTAAFKAYGIADYMRLETRLTARTATASEARILGLKRNGVVMQSFAVDGLEDGTPLQIITSAFAADRVEFVLSQEV